MDHISGTLSNLGTCLVPSFDGSARVLYTVCADNELRLCHAEQHYSDFRWRIMYSFSIHPDPYLEIYVPPQRLIDEHLSPQAMHLKPSKASFSHH
jgi:hypothetical protein